MTTELLILARAVHFGACLLFFGIMAFDRLVAAPVFSAGENQTGKHRRSQIHRFNRILLPVILLSGIAWFVLVAMVMSGGPPQMEILKTVWMQTQFGTVWKWRLFIWLAAAAVFTVSHFEILAKTGGGRRTAENRGFSEKSRRSQTAVTIWLQWFLAAVLLGSLAGAGHGLEDPPWHLPADILHLLIAGLWPTGLLPFFLLLRKLRAADEPARTDSIISLTRRFSILSLCSVALLTATGLVNSWFLVGSLHNLFSATYGRWLLAKILFFFFAIGLGAVNLMRLKPRLSQPQHSATAAAQLRRNVFIELMLMAAVIIIVAVLGILPPDGH